MYFKRAERTFPQLCAVSSYITKKMTTDISPKSESRSDWKAECECGLFGERDCMCASAVPQTDLKLRSRLVQMFSAGFDKSVQVRCIRI